MDAKSQSLEHADLSTTPPMKDAFGDDIYGASLSILSINSHPYAVHNALSESVSDSSLLLEDSRLTPRPHSCSRHRLPPSPLQSLRRSSVVYARDPSQRCPQVADPTYPDHVRRTLMELIARIATPTSSCESHQLVTWAVLCYLCSFLQAYIP